MKPLKKEDMPKLIVLIVLAVGIFGFALVQFISSSAPSAAAVSAASSGKPGESAAAGAVASAAGPASGQDAALQEVPAEPELDFLHIGPPAGGKDPFIPNGAAAAADAPPAPPAKPSAPALPRVALAGKPADFGQMFGGETSIRERPAAPAEHGPIITPLPVELPAPAWNVSGIVLAERDSDGIKRGRDVAILRDTAGNRRFVTVGDPVDNGYHVSAVLPGAVEIRSKKRTALIHLDSSTSNSSAPAAVTATSSLGTNGAITRAN